MKYEIIPSGFILRFEKGDEILHSISKFIQGQNLSSCTIQAIGSIQNPILAYYDLSTKKFTEKKFQGEYELLPCIGSVAFENDTPIIHLHASLSNSNFDVIGGHIKEMTTNATCEVFLFSLEHKLLKSYNNEVGLKLYDLQCDFNS